MKLAVVGSQVITRRQAETAWFVIEGLIAVFNPGVVISGGATGVDSVAEAVAKSLGYTPWEHDEVRPDGNVLLIFREEVKQWDPVGRYGYKARNVDIVRNSDVLVRIAKKDKQSTYGSGWTADHAEELGKDVHRIWI